MLKGFFNRGVTKMNAWLTGVIFLFVADRFLKQWALAELYNKKVTIIKKLFSLELFKNERIAFGIYLPETIIVMATAIIIFFLVFILVWRLAKLNKPFTAVEIALLLIIIGAASNLYDRLQVGFVVDYLNFVYWPVFNLADAMIGAGAIVIGVRLLKKKA